MRPLLLLLALFGCAEDSLPIPAPGTGSPLPLDEIAVPSFPERASPETLDDGVQRWVLDLGAANPGSTTPGHQGTLEVYLPAGEHADASLPAVLSAPWGGTNVGGVALQERHTEGHLAYAKAGFAVVAFSVDGVDDWEAFAASWGGAVNARNAWTYATTQLPMVDEDEVFIEGFSGGGDIALLYATQQPALRGAALINSAGLGCWFQSGPVLEGLHAQHPDLYEVCTQTSPMAQLHTLTVPTLMFANEDDTMVPRMYVKTLQRHAEAAGAPARFYLAPEGGDHERAWREQGLDFAIGWMKEQRGASPTRAPTAEAAVVSPED